MPEAVAHPFAAWEAFYVITGSSAAALTGLQFVLIALIAEGAVASTQGIAAFGTPTVLHFCAVLLVAAILSAPWHSVPPAALALGASGFAGIVYSMIVVRRTRRQTGYKPVLEDWLWHTVFPIVAYTTLLVSSILLPRSSTSALFPIAATVVFLLFIGIHNAWDAATWVVLERRTTRERPEGEITSEAPVSSP